jgi:hypothetical protein
MTRLLSEPPTVRSALFGGDRDSAMKSLSGRLDGEGLYRAVHLAAAGAGQVARDQIDSDLTRLADEMLGMRAVDLITAGWRKHAELVAAAKKTTAAADETMFVNLASHRIISRHSWTINVVISAPVISIVFVLIVAFDIDALLAVVRAGRIVGIRGGRCTMHATLTAQGRPLADQSLQFDINTQLALDPGINLLAAT